MVGFLIFVCGCFRIVKMKFLNAIFFLSLVMCSISMHGQSDTIYLDEKDHYISKDAFYRKMNSSIYYGMRFDMDTIVLEKIRFKYYLGSLPLTLKSQLHKILHKRHQIDTTKTLVIHYIDTLKSAAEFAKRSSIVYRDSLNNIVKIPNSDSFIDFDKVRTIKKHEHIWSYKEFINQHKKCTKNHQKYEDVASVLHFYNHNNGHPDEVKNVKWFKDHGSIVKKIFADSYKNFQQIIIYPNGDFYIQAMDSKIPYEDLLRKINWENHKDDFLKEMRLLNAI
jgi:hypothetical protein